MHSSMTIGWMSLLAFTSSAIADTKLLRYPDVSASQVAFVYAGDIYVAERTGGQARRLTSHVGLELFPKFSPDGKTLAFSAEYSGTRQVFSMPADGSKEPTQLTWYNDIGPMPPRGGYDYRVLDWTPDGNHIVVRMNRLGFDERAGRPYLLPADGGDEIPMAIPETGGGMLSSDGKYFVYTPIDREFRTWKRTRGGRAQDVWLYDLEKNSSLQLTNARATDNQPTWLDGAVYFTSDRDYRLNLYRVAPTGGEPVKVTNFADFDVLWPSAGPDAIVFEQAGALHLFDAKTQSSKAIAITVSGDRPGLLSSIKPVNRWIESAAISPDGDRVYFGARGELFSVNVKNTKIDNLTQTAAPREMSMSLSADGKLMSYLSNATGEYEIYQRAVAGDSARLLTKDSQAWRLPTDISANGEWILTSDTENRLQLTSSDARSTLIDQANVGAQITSYGFSPDSAHVVYCKTNAAGLSEIWWYVIATGKSQLVLGGQFDAFEPSFDPSGRFLYFASNRDHNLTFSSYEQNYLYTNATRLFVVSLKKSGPYLNALDNPLDPSKEAKLDGAMHVDLEGMEQRAEALAVASGTYSNLTASNGGLYFISTAADGNTLKFVSLASKTDTIASGVGGYLLAAGQKHLLLKIGDKWVVAEAKPATDVSKALDLSKLQLRIDPKVEWPEIYADALRVFRTWFYDPGMHGNDWQAMQDRYAVWLKDVASRDDLDYLLGEIAGELNAGHAYVNRGDQAQVPRIDSGLLGGEFSRVVDGYRIDKIYLGQNWNEEFRAPLASPGVDVRVGDVITHINERRLLDTKNFYQSLEGLGNQIVRLRVKRGANTHDTLAKTITAETNLRYLDWVATRAELVNKLSSGRIGYVHLPNTAVEGNRELFKQLPSQITKDALIVDDRYNGGGFIPDRMIEILARKPLNYWKRRGLDPQATPLLSHRGPKAMLINGLSSSGGDALPYYFKKLNLGPLIGTRTWGGLIGLSGNPPMVDGGSVTPPDFRIMDTDNQWVVENEGVAPDIEVIDRPELLAAGRDPSLERAVTELLKTLEANPPKTIQAPTPPSDFGQPR